MTFTELYLDEVSRAAKLLAAQDSMEQLASRLHALRVRGGRLFVLGVGGSAANASHAVNDFRKLAGIEAYAATDNVSELTARTNDDGWESVFSKWLVGSRIGRSDAVLVLSVGGGDTEKNISVNLVAAVNTAKAAGATVLGIVGRRDGYTAQNADCCCVVPAVQPGRLTPHAEEFQSIILHLLVSHPLLQQHTPCWEQQAKAGDRRKAVFLDRDGVLNELVWLGGAGECRSPRTVEELRFYPDIDKLKRLRDAGFLLIVVTNQPDMDRGFLSLDALSSLHAKLVEQVSLDGIFFCPHATETECACRKPKPGMLLQAAKHFNIDLTGSYMIGDSGCDILAGYEAGCHTILCRGSDPVAELAADVKVPSLTIAVDYILSKEARDAQRLEGEAVRRRGESRGDVAAAQESAD